MFTNKILLITGGTGSFGNAVLRRFLNTGIKEIRIFSRDEKKQDDMRQYYKDSKIKYYIGDVRNFDSINSAMKGVDYVFQAAALKQVPSCEFFPTEAVRTNVLGCENVLNAALENNVSRVIVLSTDKAVYPIQNTPAKPNANASSFSDKSLTRAIYNAGFVLVRTTMIAKDESPRIVPPPKYLIIRNPKTYAIINLITSNMPCFFII